MSYLKGNVISISTSIFIGSITVIISVIVLARITGAYQALIMTLEPKSVTTAIAMNISAQSGGIPSLTAIKVLFCGLCVMD